MRHKIAVVVSAPMTLKAFLLHQIEAMAENYDVVVIANFSGDAAAKDLLPDTVRSVHIPIERQIAPVSDLRAVAQLYRLFRAEGFSLTHSVSPKAGLVTALAGKMAGVPHRLHTFTGQVWATKKGLGRQVLRLIDALTASALTTVLADSRSQAAFLVKNAVVGADRVQVLADGSISGVDITRFHPVPEIRDRIRRELGFAADTVIFLFLGRLKREKGVLDLAKAFVAASARVKQAALVFVGPDEEDLQSQLEDILRQHRDDVRFLPYTSAPEHVLMAADVFCLPSYREGFGSTVIEAAACGIPAIGSRIYGLTDAIEDGRTGVLVETGDVEEIASAMVFLANNGEQRNSLAAAAQDRAVQKFSQKRVTGAVLKLYEELLVRGPKV